MQFRFRSTPIYAYLTEGEPRVCDRLMTIADPKAKNSAEARLQLWDGLIHFFERDAINLGPEDNRIPAGLLPRLVKRLVARGHDVDVTYDPPLPEMAPIAADFLIGADMDGDRSYQLDAVNIGLEYGRGIWWLATNAGKSYCIAAFVGALKRQRDLHSLVIVPNKNLVHQTSEDIVKLLGPDVRVGIAGDGIKQTNVDVLVGTYQTLVQGLPGPHTHAGIHKFISTCQCVIVDEGHHATSNANMAILKHATKAVFRIGCTGTVDKSDKSKGKEHQDNAKAIEHRWRMECFLGPVIARVSNEDLIDLGISAKPTILLVEDRKAFGDVVITPQSDPDVPKKGQQSAYQRVFEDAAINDNRFRRTVANVTSAYLAQGRPPFIFSHSVKQLKRLKQTLDHFGVPCELLEGKASMHRRREVLARFKKQGDFAILTSPIFDEGASVPEIRGVILAGARKSPVELLQRIGRGLRRKAGDNTITVTDFSMLHSKMLNHHFRSRVASYIDEGFDVHRVGDVGSFSQINL